MRFATLKANHKDERKRMTEGLAKKKNEAEVRGKSVDGVMKGLDLVRIHSRD
jgi:hypothetical protein